MARRCCSSEPVPTPLKEAGLKRTAQREAILAALEASDRPLTVEEIRQRLGDTSSGVPTIYRNLQRFVEEGWAEALPSTDQVQRYVRCRSREHHHHILCETCGRVDEVTGCGLDAVLLEMVKATGYVLTEHRLALTGRCRACQEHAGIT